LADDYPSVFGGESTSNLWLDVLADDQTYDPQLGHGYVITGTEDGLPAVRVFCHVDDFLIHGPTYKKTALGLNALMDKAARVGFLFNPTKVTPPSQIVKYCGILYDTETHPTLHVPEDKRDQALTMLEYVLSQRNTKLSKLGLSVAASSRIGQTLLRKAFNKLYRDDEGDAPDNARW
jgi:hypothetical protein